MDLLGPGASWPAAEDARTVAITVSEAATHAVEKDVQF